MTFKNFLNIKKNLIIFLLGIILLSIFAALWFINLYSFSLKIELIALDRNDSIDIYYSSGSSFADKPETVAYFASDQKQIFYFKLPNDTEKIQIIPGHTETKFKLLSIEIDTGFFSSIKLESKQIMNYFKTNNQIINISELENVLSFDSIGYEPYFESNEILREKILYIKNKSNIKYRISIILLLLFSMLIFLLRKRILIFYNFIKSIRWVKIFFQISVSILFGLFLTLILSKSSLSIKSFLYSLELLFSFFIISLIGFCIIIFIKGVWFNFQQNFFLFHSFILGQIFLIIYIYFRSFLNASTGFIIPISFLDFLFILAVLLFIIIKTKKINLIMTIMKVEIHRWVLFFLFTWIIFLIISINEIPISISYESDHQVHFLMVKQIERFGTIPFSSQFFWGNTDLGYPAGFAVISFIWNSLSFLNIQNSVVIQPLIQTQLALFLLLEVFLILKSIKEKKDLFFNISIFFTFFFIYYYFLPYGYYPYYKTAHTGILSSWSIWMPFISLLFFVVYHWKNTNYQEYFNLTVNHSISVLLIAILFLINPTLIIYPICIYFIVYMIILNKYKKWKDFLNLLFTFPLFLIVSFDSYFSFYINTNFAFLMFLWVILLIVKYRFKNSKKIYKFLNIFNLFLFISFIAYFIFTQLNKNVNTLSLTDRFKYLFDFVINKFVFLKQTLLQFSSLGDKNLWQYINYGELVSIKFLITFVLLSCILYVFAYIYKYIKKTELLFLLSLPVFSFILFVTVSSIGRTISEFKIIPAFFLFEAYIEINRVQLNFVMIFIFILTLIFLLYHFLNTKKNYFKYFISFCFLTFIIIQGSFSYFKIKIFTSGEQNIQHNLAGWYYPRKDLIDINIGNVYKDDYLVIEKIEQLFYKYKTNNLSLNYNTIPKILLPAHIFSFEHHGFKNIVEKNFRFTGASNILPLYNVFPTAFYRVSGSKDFSVDNYEQRICNDLDESWLKQKNVKYLFIPTSNEKTCIYKLDSLIKTKKILFNEGKTFFIQLYD